MDIETTNYLIMYLIQEHPYQHYHVMLRHHAVRRYTADGIIAMYTKMINIIRTVTPRSRSFRVICYIIPHH